MTIYPFYVNKQGVIEGYHGTCGILIAEKGEEILWSLVGQYYTQLSTKCCGHQMPALMFLIQIATGDSLETLALQLTVHSAFLSKPKTTLGKLEAYLSGNIDSFFRLPPTLPPQSVTELNLKTLANNETANRQKKIRARETKEAPKSREKKKQKITTSHTAVDESEEEQYPTVAEAPYGLQLHTLISQSLLANKLKLAFTSPELAAEYADIEWIFTRRHLIPDAPVIGTTADLSCRSETGNQQFANAVVCLVLYCNNTISLYQDLRCDEWAKLSLPVMAGTSFEGVVFTSAGISVAYVRTNLNNTSHSLQASTYQSTLQGFPEIDILEAVHSADATGTTSSDQDTAIDSALAAFLHHRGVDGIKRQLMKDPAILFRTHHSGLTVLEIVEGVIQENQEYHRINRTKKEESAEEEEEEDEDSDNEELGRVIWEKERLHQVQALTLLGVLMVQLADVQHPCVETIYRKLEQTELGVDELLNELFEIWDTAAFAPTLKSVPGWMLLKKSFDQKPDQDVESEPKKNSEVSNSQTLTLSDDIQQSTPSKALGLVEALTNKFITAPLAPTITTSPPPPQQWKPPTREIGKILDEETAIYGRNHYIIVFDTSKSMNKQDVKPTVPDFPQNRFGALIQGVNGFVSDILTTPESKHSLMTVMAFDNEVEIFAQKEPLSLATIRKLKEVTPSAGTMYLKAFREIRKAYQPGMKNIVIFLSDGGAEDREDRMIQEVRYIIQTCPGIAFQLYGFGKEDFLTLKKLASSFPMQVQFNESKFNVAEIKSTFSLLSKSIISSSGVRNNRSQAR